jgi:hypothetical protein
MPNRPRRFTKRTANTKECWHTYGLQALPPAKFASVVKKIMLDPSLLVAARTNQTVSA